MRPLDRAALRAWAHAELGLEADWPDDAPLFSSGRLDSFALVDLLGWIESSTGVIFADRDIRLEHVDAIDRLDRFVERRRGEGDGRREDG